jgi:hypothetical protein
VFFNKYWKDLKFLAHFIGHVTLEGELTVSRRKRWIRQEFGLRLKEADVALILRLFESRDVWIDNVEEECIREHGQPPPYDCWCDNCQRQRLYNEVRDIINAKNKARQAATDNHKLEGSIESNQVIYARALKSDNQILNCWLSDT